MKIISERVSTVTNDKVFSLVILPTVDKRKLWILFFWLFAWTICGVIVFANYFRINNADAKTFIIVYLSFWFYFEYKIARAFLWKKFGKEKLWIRGGTLYYQREVSGKGKIKEFDVNLITVFDYIEVDHISFADNFNQSFWVKGGERIEFECRGKIIRLGMQLDDKEAREILKEIKSALTK